MPGTNYWQSTRSANPHPVCRRNGCGETVADDSEWCATHTVDVTVGQAFAAAQLVIARKERTTRYRPPSRIDNV